MSSACGGRARSSARPSISPPGEWPSTGPSRCGRRRWTASRTPSLLRGSGGRRSIPATAWPRRRSSSPAEEWRPARSTSRSPRPSWREAAPWRRPPRRSPLAASSAAVTPGSARTSRSSIRPPGSAARTAPWARSGSRGRASPRATGSGRWRRSAAFAAIRRGRRGGHPICAAAIWASSPAASSSSPAGSRSSSSCAGATSIRRMWRSPRSGAIRACGPAAARRSRSMPKAGSGSSSSARWSATSAISRPSARRCGVPSRRSTRRACTRWSSSARGPSPRPRAARSGA